MSDNGMGYSMQLQARIRELEQGVAALAGERDLLRAQVNRLTAERDVAGAALTCERRQYSAACHRRDVLQADCDQLRAQVERLRAQDNRLRGES